MHMKEIHKVYSEKIMVQSTLPIISIYEMKTCQSENNHGILWMQAIIMEENQRYFMEENFTNEIIAVFEHTEEGDKPLFQGKIDRIQCRKEDQVLLAEIYGISSTYELDQVRKNQSFQDPQLTYEEITEQIAKGHSAGFLWNSDQGQKIGTPIIQYGESDWEFLIRLASHFHTVIYPDCLTGRVNFSFGVPLGRERKRKDSFTLEYGFSDAYYREGGYGEGQCRDQYYFLKTQVKELWQIGDYLIHENSHYYVYKGEASFTKGELNYTYMLGKSGMTWKKKIYNHNLQGLRLRGRIKKVELESVFLQFEMDQKECADFAWPWVPEIGNHCYCMPEKNTTAVLYFVTGQEQDGLAIHTVREDREDNLYQEVQNREFVTTDDKKLCLYPNDLIVGVKMDSSKINLTDERGIQLSSDFKINISAKNKMQLKAKSISIKSPQEITYRTSISNLEINKNFNFYAPRGVRTKGGKSMESIPDIEEDSSQRGNKEFDHWQASFSALAAIPAVDITNMKKDAVIDLATCGAIAKTAKGAATIAMKETMNGKKVRETTYPEVFRSMDNYTLNGGYPLPKRDGQ